MYLNPDVVVYAVVIKSRRWSEGIATLYLIDVDHSVAGEIGKGNIKKHKAR